MKPFQVIQVNLTREKVVDVDRFDTAEQGLKWIDFVLSSADYVVTQEKGRAKYIKEEEVFIIHLGTV